MKLVVVGNGMAGFRFCQLLTERPVKGIETLVFGEERLPAYDRVHLTEYLDRPSIDRLLLAPRRWYADRGLELRTGARIAELDRRRCLVRTADGEAIGYDRLILATGSVPFEPPIPGIHTPGVFVYRTFDDLDAIRQRAAAARRAIVIGGGLLGLEAARGLQRLGLAVTVLEAAPQLMPRQLDEGSAQVLGRQVRRLGIDVRVGVRVRAIGTPTGAIQIALATGAPLEADLVVVAAGIRPRDAIARRAGLEVGPSGGIAVDDEMQTSDERILAIGECAAHDGVVHGLVRPCYEMARVAAARVLGKPARFQRPDDSCRLDLAGIDAVIVGRYDRNGAGISHDTGDGRRTLCVERGRLVGVCGIGAWPEVWRFQQAIERRTRLRDRDLDRFQRTGTIWSRGKHLPVASWPADAAVCQCRSVTRGQLTAAVRCGALTPSTLGTATGAGTVCGSCEPLLAELCQRPAEASRSLATRALWLMSLLALTGCAALLWVRPGSWQLADVTGWRLLEDERISGFAVLGCCSLALLLSLRKRLRWFERGSFGSWRAVHAAVGVIGLAMVGAHTGFSIGNNLNRLLAITFLGVVATGSLTGIGAAAEAGSGTTALVARRYRRLLGWLHWSMLWPLPGLIAIHILAAYYF